MRFDIEPKTCFKWFAELEEIPLHIWNLVEYIHSNWVFFAWASLALLEEVKEVKPKIEEVEEVKPK